MVIYVEDTIDMRKLLKNKIGGNPNSHTSAHEFAASLDILADSTIYTLLKCE
jgi:hypothetical protein